MTHQKIITAISILLISTTAWAQDSGFGLGIIAGEPTGISFKSWVGPERAIDGAFAWSLGHGGAVHMHADYLFHNYGVFNVNKGRLPLYYGPGLRLRVRNDGRHYYRGDYHDHGTHANLAVRFPVGLAYQFGGAPLDVFLEVVPALSVIPATYLDFDGGIGMRFWF